MTTDVCCASGTPFCTCRAGCTCSCNRCIACPRAKERSISTILTVIEKLSESDRTIVSDIVNTQIELVFQPLTYSIAQLKALALDSGGYRRAISRALDILIRIRYDEIISSDNEPWESADDTDLDFPHEYGLPHEFS